MEHKKSEETVKAKKPDIKPAAKKIRRPYEKPTVTQLTPEQATLKLLGAVSDGDEGAKDLLEKMFPEATTKKSA